MVIDPTSCFMCLKSFDGKCVNRIHLAEWSHSKSIKRGTGGVNCINSFYCCRSCFVEHCFKEVDKGYHADAVKNRGCFICKEELSDLADGNVIHVTSVGCTHSKDYPHIFMIMHTECFEIAYGIEIFSGS